VIGDNLTGALERIAAALDAGDAMRAAAELGAAHRLCAVARDERVRFDVETLSRLQALHARCNAAAVEARTKLLRDLASAASARRATAAYGR
jgi:hypothetical protein